MQQLYGTPQRSTDGDEQLKYSFFDQSRNPPADSPQQLNSCCTKSMKFCRSGSSRYSVMICNQKVEPSVRWPRGERNRKALTRSVNESSKTVFMVCGKINAMIATAISQRKKISKHSE